MSSKRDYYAVLGVDRDADTEAIKRAYRRLAKQHHPDTNNAPDAEARFKEINEAYEVLSDPQKRATYDRFGSVGGSSPFGGPRGGPDISWFEDIFEQFFTGYFKRVRYREWSDASPPIVAISPDGKLGWMAVAIVAKYTRADKPEEGEKSFKSSWIATYERANCTWRMTGIASSVVNE